MTRSIPVRDLKRTAAVEELLKESGGELRVTRNGYDLCVMLSAERYDGLMLELARGRLREKLELAEADIKQGSMADLDEALEMLRLRYGL